MQRIAKVIAKAVGLVGTLSIEMFYTETGGIYVNKILPRPEDAGNFSIDACSLANMIRIFVAYVIGQCQRFNCCLKQSRSMCLEMIL